LDFRRPAGAARANRTLQDERLDAAFILAGLKALM
jgi:hypothetical protein